jgi:hypothetical protein
MILRHSLAPLAGIALIAMPAIAAPKPQESWGQAGVDFDTYRNDAIECAARAYYADISDTDHAKAFVSASKRLESTDDTSMGQANASAADDMTRMVNAAAQQQRIVESVRPEKRMRELEAGLQQVLEDCLTERGYVKFRLSEEQRAWLGTLDKGSEDRRRYLHSLASNETVLETQRVPSES